MREVECSREASDYLMDSWPYTEPVLRALVSLSRSSALPGEELEAGSYLWQVAEHMLIYERRGSNLRVTIIKPNPDLEP